MTTDRDRWGLTETRRRSRSLDQMASLGTTKAGSALEEPSSEKTRKGYGIGYALATSSYERADSVEACTVAAPDAITAFAVPNPSCPSQSSRFFRVW